MTRPEGLSAEEREDACTCGHGVIWHHEGRGCSYLGFNVEHRCPCRLLFHEALAEYVNPRLAAQAEDIAKRIEALKVGSGNRYRDRMNPSQMRAAAAAIARGGTDEH